MSPSPPFTSIDQPTIDTYNQLAREYDAETVDFWERFPRDFFDKFVAQVGSGKHVLDIGSGPGRDGLIMQQLGLDVTCLDASLAMIQLCQDRGLRAVLGDFNALPFPDSSLDAVWAYTALLHVPKHAISQSMSEIRRVLRPGGILGLGMMQGTTEGYGHSAGVTKPRWFSYYTESGLKQLLDAYGFDTTHFSTLSTSKHIYLNFIAKKQLDSQD